MVNEKYSYEDFMNRSFRNLPASDFNNSLIIGSCFYQEILTGTPERDIFPDDLVNVIFEKCNLHNVIIKPGMTIGLGNCTHNIQVDPISKKDFIMKKSGDTWIKDKRISEDIL